MQPRHWFNVPGAGASAAAVKGNRLNRVDDLYCRLKAVKLIRAVARTAEGVPGDAAPVRIESPFGVSRRRDKNININHGAAGRAKIEGGTKRRESGARGRERGWGKGKKRERRENAGSGVYSIHFVHPLAHPFTAPANFARCLGN